MEPRAMRDYDTFQISWDEFLDLSFELLFLIESHRPVCRWLGPYEEDEATCAVARLYKEKFEGKLSRLLISIASNLRILEDRGILGGDIIGQFPKGEDYDSSDSQVYQADVGQLRDSEDGKWKPLISLRPLLNTIMHSERIEFGISVLENAPTINREVRGFDNVVIVSAPLPRGKKGQNTKTIRLNLLNFARYLFDIVEASGSLNRFHGATDGLNAKHQDPSTRTP